MGRSILNVDRKSQESKRPGSGGLAIVTGLVLLLFLKPKYHLPKAAEEKAARGVFKAASSFLRWARKYGPKEPVTIELRHEARMPKAQFRRKALALQKLGEEDKLFKAINPVRRRDGTRRVAHQQDLIRRIHAQYGQRNPELSRRLIRRITNGSMELDHVNELQTAGADLRYNMRYLDAFTNNRIGTQIRRQLLHVEDGTPIRIRIIE
jgi:hypothetical protein